jgi:hypothetical protein
VIKLVQVVVDLPTDVSDKGFPFFKWTPPLHQIILIHFSVASELPNFVLLSSFLCFLFKSFYQLHWSRSALKLTSGESLKKFGWVMEKEVPGAQHEQHQDQVLWCLHSNIRGQNRMSFGDHFTYS